MSSNHSDKPFRLTVTVTLTLHPMTLKSIGVIYWSPPASMSSLRAMGAANVELSLGQAFHVQGHCDLDLWPKNLNIKRGHLLVISSLHIKFEGHGCKQCRVITLTSFCAFKVTVTLTFDLMTSKSIGYVYWSSPTSKSSLRTISQGIVELSLGQALVYRRTDRHVQSNIPLFYV